MWYSPCLWVVSISMKPHALWGFSVIIRSSPVAGPTYIARIQTQYNNAHHWHNGLPYCLAGQVLHLYIMTRFYYICSCRYDFGSNTWLKETSLKKKIAHDESCGFAAMNGDLYVLTPMLKSDNSEFRRAYKRRPTLEVQVYSPNNKKWRLFTAHPPLHRQVEFKSTTLCTIHI